MEPKVIATLEPDRAAKEANRLCARLAREGLIEPMGRSVRASQRYELFCEAIADELWTMECEVNARKERAEYDREQQAAAEVRGWNSVEGGGDDA